MAKSMHRFQRKQVSSTSLEKILAFLLKTKITALHISDVFGFLSDEPWHSSPYFISGLAVFILLLVICPISFMFTVYRKRNRHVETGLANFVDGDIKGFNPELALDAQADLLPYDRRYEFPRNKLKFGEQLGAGAFGIVLEAMAQGIKADEEETKVAVKMVKNVASNEVSH